MDDPKLLEVQDLSIIYKTDLETVYAVNNISFTLKKGETLGIVGETGAGKTTTALALMRLLPDKIGIVTGGGIQFEGGDLLALPAKEMRGIRGKRIAMIFQDPMTSLNPVIPVGDQIGEAIELHNPTWSKAQINQRVEEVLTMVGIDPTRKQEYPHQFSGGMKQRVVIAMALSCEPDLLIADEPTTALDVTIQAQVLLMMRDLKKRLGTAMIMITHDFGIIAQTCDKVAVMYAGEFIESGSLEELFCSEDHHPYTTGLFGSIPSMTDKSRRLHPIDGLMPDPTIRPAGCAFAPRCPHATELCRTRHPEPHTKGTHTICCHLFDEVKNNG